MQFSTEIILKYAKESSPPNSCLTPNIIWRERLMLPKEACNASNKDWVQMCAKVYQLYKEGFIDITEHTKNIWKEYKNYENNYEFFYTNVISDAYIYLTIKGEGYLAGMNPLQTSGINMSRAEVIALKADFNQFLIDADNVRAYLEHFHNDHITYDEITYRRITSLEWNKFQIKEQQINLIFNRYNEAVKKFNMKFAEAPIKLIGKLSTVNNIRIESLVSEQINVSDLVKNESQKAIDILTDMIDSNSGTLATGASNNFIFIDCEFVDPFYKTLKSEVNKCYNAELYTACVVLSRKIIENLLIDLLRKKYPPNSYLALYYSKTKGRFNDFSVLINTLDDKKDEFVPDKNEVESLLKLLKEFRERANSNTHSISISSNKKDIDKFEIPKMVNLLVHIKDKIE